MTDHETNKSLLHPGIIVMALPAYFVMAVMSYYPVEAVDYVPWLFAFLSIFMWPIFAAVFTFIMFLAIVERLRVKSNRTSLLLSGLGTALCLAAMMLFGYWKVFATFIELRI